MVKNAALEACNMKCVLGIDIGGSTTKIIGYRNGKIFSPFFVKASDPRASLYGAFGKFLSENNLTLSDIESVMMTGVGAEDAQKLGGIISVYRQHQANMAAGDVQPIGQKPDGTSFTGFCIDCGAEGGYLILFREWTQESAFRFEMPVWKGKNVRMNVLKANAQIGLEAADGMLRFEADSARSYAFVRYDFAD